MNETADFKTIPKKGKPIGSDWDWQQKIVDDENKKPGKLNEQDGIDCPICKNRGYITVLVGDPETDPFPDMAQRWCKCMERRKIVWRANDSGMGPMLGRKFSEFKASEPWQKEMKQKAIDYAKHPGGWFTAVGQIGSGKTMIASCVANQLLRDGYKLIVKSWPELVREAGVDWYSEKEALKKYQQIECLFIDDFLKTKPNDRALDIAFELLDYRYRNNMLTLLTSEKSPNDISAYDSAIWSRIRQASGSHITIIAGDNGKDQRRKTA